MDNNNKYEGFSSQSAMELYHEVCDGQLLVDMHKRLQENKEHPDFYEVWCKLTEDMLNEITYGIVSCVFPCRGI